MLQAKQSNTLPGTTVLSIALAWCDVLADFPRHFDRVFSGHMRSRSAIICLRWFGWCHAKTRSMSPWNSA